MKYFSVFIYLSLLTSFSHTYAFWNLDKLDKKDKKAQTRSNWFWGLGGNYQKTDNKFSFTEGRKNKIEPDDSIDLLGAEFRVGGELGLGPYLSLILSVDINYGQEEDRDQIKPLKSTNIDVPLKESIIRTSSLRGGVSAGLGFLPFKIWGLTVLPVLEVGIGKGWFKKYANYYYDESIGGGISEYYREKYKQDFNMFRVGAGFNIISSIGFYSYFRLYSTTYDLEASTGTQNVSFQLGGANPRVRQLVHPGSSETQITFSIGLGQRF